MDITVRIKQNFGRTDIYPVCERAQIFARIANAATLTQKVIEHIKTLGYTVKVQPSAPDTL